MKQKVCVYILVSRYLKFELVGLSLIEFLEVIAARMQHFETGRIEYDDIDEKVQDYLSEFRKRDVIEAKLHLGEVKSELEGEWNTYRDLVNNNDKQGEGSSSKTLDEGESSRVKPSIGASTSKRKLTFKKTTPKSKLMDKLLCGLCRKSYESLKALQKHCRKHHDGAGVGDGNKEIAHKVTCMICKSKLSRDLITRHIVRIHGYDKPEKNSNLRGFLTLNDKNWKPLWMMAHQDEPPKEMIVPVDKDGRVEMYGVIFEKEDMEFVDDDDDLNDGVKNDPFQDCIDEIMEENIQTESDNNEEEDNKFKPKAEVSEDKIGTKDDSYDMNEVCDTVDEIVNKKGLRSKSFRYETRSVKNKSRKNLVEEFYKEDITVDPGSVNVETFTVDVKDGRFGGGNTEDQDSDFDPDDSKDVNDTRVHNKAIRRAKRDNINVSVLLTDLRLNAPIIEEFGRFIASQKIDSCGDPSKLSTVQKAKGHLFHYDDSYLRFEYSKDPDFNLKRLVSPKDKDFLELADPSEPGGWLESVSGDSGRKDPGRRREMLKAHVSFRNYLYQKLIKSDFGSQTEDYLKRQMVLKNLDNIERTIEKKKLFKVWNNMEIKEKNERLKARNVLSPSNDYNEAHCVIVWFESDEAKEEEIACLEIYDKCDEVEPTSREFVRFGRWARWTIACEDRNRKSVYEFTNLQYMMRKPKWLPPRNEGDTRMDFERFQKLPPDWNPDVPPSKGAEPSCWVIEVSGENLKNREDAQLVLTRRGAEICVKYREMKRRCGLDDKDPKSRFFVNKQGKPLGRMQNTKGSLMEKFGIVCGIKNVTTNSLRRAAEVSIQNSPVMKQSVEKLQLHSKAVGLQYYDKTTQNVRCNFVDQLSHMESPSKNVPEIPPEVKKRRTEYDDEDKEVVVKEAEKILNRSKLKRKSRRSRGNRLLPDEKELLMKVYSPGINERFNGALPGNYFH